MPAREPNSEFELIDWIRQRSRARAQPWTRLGIGDDCAILDVGSGTKLLITTDMLMDGRHFRLDLHGPEAVGHKALGVNLSDIAAMAGLPRAAVVAVALPRAGAIEVAQGIHRGMMALAERFDVDLVGGDTNAWDGPLVVAVTLIGEATERGAVCRSGAKPGDAILVTGALGGSLHSGRHLRVEPRVAEALALHAAAPLHALIDISDGLSSDLSHILTESGGLGAILDETAIPIHPDAREISLVDGRSRLGTRAKRRRRLRALRRCARRRPCPPAGRSARRGQAVSRRRNFVRARTHAPLVRRKSRTDHPPRLRPSQE